MLLRLALAAGGAAVLDPDAFARHMPATVLQRWLAFFEAEPWGGAEDWKRAGEVWAMVANARPFRPPGSKELTADMVGPRPHRPPPDPAAAAAARRQAMKVLAGKIGALRPDGSPAAPADF